MRDCQKCGSSLEENATYCINCGTPLNKEEQYKSGNQDVAQSPDPQAPQKQRTRKNKILLVSGLITIILLIGIHFLFQNLFSTKRMIESFEQALIDGNVKTVASLLSYEDEDLEISETAVAGFVKFYQENPEAIDSTVSDLKKQLETLKHSSEQHHTTIDGMVYLKKEGSILFHDQYKLVVPSVHLEISTNYQGTVLFVNEVEVGKAKFDNSSREYGPFVPGIHTIKGTLKTDYVDLSAEREVLIDGKSKKVEVDLHLNGDEVTFDLGDYEGVATLFINGIEIDKNLVEDPTFGPIKIDGSVSFSIGAELPWGTVKTEEAPIDSKNINVEFLNKDVKNNMMKTIHTFNSERILVRTSADGSKITTATEQLKNELISQAEQDRESNYVYTAKHFSTTFDLDSFDLEYKPVKDVWYAYASAKPVFLRDYYKKGQDANGLVRVEEGYDYVLIYDEVQGKWLVDEESESEKFNDKNAQILTVEEPIQLTSEWAK